VLVHELLAPATPLPVTRPKTLRLAHKEEERCLCAGRYPGSNGL